MSNQKTFYVYILSNEYHTTFYTGVTNDLNRRVYQHKHKLIDGFTKRYNLKKLIYYESVDNAESAIWREKQIKDYRREKKLKLISNMNPNMRDLYSKIQ